jgi:hypothetical protein
MPNKVYPCVSAEFVDERDKISFSTKRLNISRAMHITVDNVKFELYVILQGFWNLMYRFGLQAGVTIKVYWVRWDKVTVRKHSNILHEVIARVSEGLVPECI